MPSLFSEICSLIDRGSYVVGEHASERLLERGIMEWQVIAGMPDAKLLAERRTALVTVYLLNDNEPSEEG